MGGGGGKGEAEKWRKEKGRCKLIRDAAGKSHEPGFVYKPRGARILLRVRSPCAPRALFVPSRKTTRNGALPSTGTLRLPGKNSPVPGRRKVDVDWSSERKAKRRKEKKQEGGTRDNVLRGTLFKNNIKRLTWSRGSARLSPDSQNV